MEDVDGPGGARSLVSARGARRARQEWENLSLLRHYLERHSGKARGVAWPRYKVEMPRASVYDKLLAPRGIFVQGAQANLREGQRYSLETVTGEAWSGRVEFVAPSRGFCVTIDSLNDALALLTIEGSGPQHDAQLWFSTYGLPGTQVSEIEQRGTQR